jgi:two-component system response regulator YesN
MTLLIVEDEIIIREGLCKLIGKMFPELQIMGAVENGAEGLRWMEEKRPDIVITDVKMPVMDGIEMLSRAQEQGLHPKAVILTAYSEFSYAQQAVKLGVNDYIIKPVVVPEFVQTIRKVVNLCIQEQKKMPETMGNLENILFHVLYGTSALEEPVKEYLYKRFGISGHTPLIGLLIYLGSSYQEDKKRVKKETGFLLEQKGNLKYCMVEMEYDHSVFVLLYGYESRQELERWYQNRVLLQNRDARNRYLSHGMIEVTGIEEVREGCQKLLQYADWNIALGDQVLVSYPKIKKVQTSICIYPVEIENQLKIAVCTGEADRIREVVENFHRYFADGRIYVPKEIKESYVRFMWALINISKEVGCMDAGVVNHQKLLDHIMNARTWAELKEPCSRLIQKINANAEEKGIVSLPVRKAQSMIHEFYMEGITLGEIADRLQVTQEYLGNQFRRELGENFSAYIRNYRLRKAKELLIGTQMKQYEIAEKVGYTDAKYFARVFREHVGMSPAEYRKANR